MLNLESIQCIENAAFSQGFIKPQYRSFCFSRLPATVQYLLTGEGYASSLPSSCFTAGEYDTVVVIVLDAFGWEFMQRHLNHPWIHRFYQEGVVSKITSQFPSTTAAHMTTLHTGMEVGETGIYEWFQYEPMLKRVIAPLLFSYAGDNTADKLFFSDVAPHEIFPFTTLYEHLHQKGVDSYIFQSASITQSGYSQMLCRGAHQVGFLDLQQGLRSLWELLSAKKEKKTYALFYYGQIDSMGHRKSPDSRAFDKTIHYCLNLLEKELSPVISRAHNTALFVTADHGMVPVQKENIWYVQDHIPSIYQWLSQSTPCGSCRDLFLSVQPEYTDACMQEIQNLWQGRGEVWKIDHAIKEGIFGSRPVTQRFLERVGNIVCLPYASEHIWLDRQQLPQHFIGAHGGLTKQEMESILLFL